MSDSLPKILIVDDEIQIRKLLRLTLSTHFKIEEAINGREAVSFCAKIRPELIVLDLGLPDIDGLNVLKQIREWSEVPIIILTVVDDSETIIKALEMGADDYMTKPFEAGELLARIRVSIRRAAKRDQEQSIFELKHLKVDLTSRLVYKHGQEVKLTATEYDLLKLFIKNINKVLTTQQILKEIWGPSSLENAQYPRVYLRHLRQKLEENPDEPVLFQTEAGVGYRLRAKE